MTADGLRIIAGVLFFVLLGILMWRRSHKQKSVK